jgi:CRP/FNR family transcriptional regulator
MILAKASRARARVPDGGADKATSAGGVRVRIGRRQHVSLEKDAAETFYLVESGCLLVDGHLATERRQVALVLFPGDMICRAAAPPLSDIGLTATVPSEMIRLADVSRLGGGAAVASPSEQLARLAARYAMHAIVLNKLTAGERVATLLLELALRFGRRTPGGCTFELPLSRTDMADFLALNPDTMSRLMSRLKAEGLLAMTSRGMATVRNFDVLAARTPMAGALRRLFPAAHCVGDMASGVVA